MEFPTQITQLTGLNRDRKYFSEACRCLCCVYGELHRDTDTGDGGFHIV